MSTLAQTAYLESELGAVHDLPHAGSSLENPFVYDSVARDLKAMADRGMVEIVVERMAAVARDPLIRELSFRRLR
jgi:hypothetical protein